MLRSLHWQTKITALAIAFVYTIAAPIVMAQPDPNDPPKGANPPEEGVRFKRQPARVTNLVLFKPDGTPLTNASVNVILNSKLSSSSLITSTNADGHLTLIPYEFPWMAADRAARFPAGPQTIYLTVPGVGSLIVTQTEIKGENAALVKLKLQPTGTVRVTAREAEGGHALGGATISVRYLEDDQVPPRDEDQPHPRGVRMFSEFWTRDGSGVCEIKDLFPGRYLVRVSMLGLEYKTWVQEVKIEANQTVVLNADLARVPNTSLKIRIEDLDRNPVADTEMQLLLCLTDLAGASDTHPSSLRRTILTDAQGEATLYPIKSGRWHISASEIKMIRPQQIDVLGSGNSVVLVANMRDGQITRE